MKILMIGDVVGSPGRRILKERLPQLRRELGLGAVVVNAENAPAHSTRVNNKAAAWSSPRRLQTDSIDFEPFNIIPDFSCQTWCV